MKSLTSMIAAGAFGLAMLSGVSPAAAVECVSTGSGVTRTWNLDPANSCATIGGNAAVSADVTGVGGSFAGDPWTKSGDIASGGDGSQYLDITLTSGTWGGKEAEGTWTLTELFWQTFGEAVIHIHVGGNPQRLPDETALFYITKNSLSGTWSYSQDPTTGEGGGLSNLTLWGRGPGDSNCCDNNVPEPGSMALLGLGLVVASAVAIRRRRDDEQD